MITTNAKRILACLIATILAAVSISFATLSTPANADDNGPAKRTILLYLCGSNLEGDSALATHNLLQILSANFSADDDVRFVVMTGGSDEWYMESEYLWDPDLHLPETGISSEYNQIWEAKGADSPDIDGDIPLKSKLILLDADGISGDGPNAKPSEEELMSDPETLKAFINYGVSNFPAEKYDLILWDHGGGPSSGFGADLYGIDPETWEYDMMSFSEIIDALEDNDLTQSGRKFDFIDFDACLMNTVELDLAMAEYTNYYIASTETEPGYGQEYSGWLNKVGADPEISTFEVGKVLVDDFISYYEDPSSPGYGMGGTLAIVDMNRLMDTNFVNALNVLNDVLYSQVANQSEDEYLFYDELASVKNSIMYGDTPTFRDFGNILQQIAVAFREVSADNIADGTYSPLNTYKDATLALLNTLDDPTIIYQKSTSDITADYQMATTDDGSLQYERLTPSGVHIFFPSVDGTDEVLKYYDAVKQVIDASNLENPQSVAFLDRYLDTMTRWALLVEAGKAVSELVDTGTPKSEITYDKVKQYWVDTIEYDLTTGQDRSVWDGLIAPLIANAGGENTVGEWLANIISQQARDAIVKDNITGYVYQSQYFDGYRIEIEDTDKRITEAALTKVEAEFPSVKEFLDNNGFAQWLAENKPYLFRFAIDTIDGSLDYSDSEMNINDPLEKIMEDYITWYSKNESNWNLDATLRPVFALQDADGNLHAVKAEAKGDNIIINITYPDPTVQVARNGKLVFSPSDDGYVLSEIYLSWYYNERPLSAASLTAPLADIKTSYRVSYYSSPFNIPLTTTPFTIAPENAGSIRLVLADIDDITDIADTDGDGQKVNLHYVVKDLYNHEFDVTDIVNSATDTVYNIDLTSIEDVYDNGSIQGPRVIFNGKVLTEGVDYVWEKVDENASHQAPGTYDVVLRGMGRFVGKITVQYKILPLDNGGGTDPDEQKSDTDGADNTKSQEQPTDRIQGTGDDINIALLVGMALTATAVMAVAAVARRKMV